MAKKRQENNKQRNVYLSNCITDHIRPHANRHWSESVSSNISNCEVMAAVLTFMWLRGIVRCGETFRTEAFVFQCRKWVEPSVPWPQLGHWCQVTQVGSMAVMWSPFPSGSAWLPGSGWDVCNPLLVLGAAGSERLPGTGSDFMDYNWSRQSGEKKPTVSQCWSGKGGLLQTKKTRTWA